MALQQTLEKVTHDDVLFRCSNVAAKSTIVTYTVGNPGFVEKLSGSPIGGVTKVAGLLLINVVNRALPSNLTVIGDDTGTTDLPKNHNKNETNVSGTVRILRIGTAECNQLTSGDEFGPGSGVYLGDDGLLTSAAGNEQIGHALTGIRDGFVRVFVNVQ